MKTTFITLALTAVFAAAFADIDPTIGDDYGVHVDYGTGVDYAHPELPADTILPHDYGVEDAHAEPPVVVDGEHLDYGADYLHAEPLVENDLPHDYIVDHEHPDLQPEDVVIVDGAGPHDYGADYAHPDYIHEELSEECDEALFKMHEAEQVYLFSKDEKDVQAKKDSLPGLAEQCKKVCPDHPDYICKIVTEDR